MPRWLKVFIVLGCVLFFAAGGGFLIYAVRAAAVRESIEALEQNGAVVFFAEYRSDGSGLDGRGGWRAHPMHPGAPLEERYAVLAVDLSDPDAPVEFRGAVKKSEPRRAKAASKPFGPLTPEVMAHVLRFPELRRLDLRGRVVEPACWPIFARLKTPHQILVGGPRIDASFLDEVEAAPNLVQLDLVCDTLASPASLDRFRLKNPQCDVRVEVLSADDEDEPARPAARPEAPSR